MNENVYYSLVNALYYMMTCGPYNYATPYLTEWGFSTSQIGTISLAAGVLGLVLQLSLADISDKSSRISPTGVFLITLPIAIGAALCMYFFGHLSSIVFIGVFMLAYIIPRILQSLITGFAFVIENAKHVHLNFGFCRAMGSFGFIFFNLLHGRWMQKDPFLTFPMAIAGGCAILWLIFFFFYRDLKPQGNKGVKRVKMGSPLELFKNKNYLSLVVGAFFVFYGPNAVGTFMYQKLLSIGRTTADIGGLASIAAVLEMPSMLLFDKVRHHMSAAKIIVITGFISTIRCVVLALAPNIVFLYIAYILQGMSWGLMAPAIARFINEKVDPSHVNTGQAYYYFSTSFVSMVASFIGGIMIEKTSLIFMFLSACGVSFLGMLIFVFGLEDRKTGKTDQAKA